MKYLGRRGCGGVDTVEEKGEFECQMGRIEAKDFGDRPKPCKVQTMFKFANRILGYCPVRYSQSDVVRLGLRLASMKVATCGKLPLATSITLATLPLRSLVCTNTAVDSTL